MPSGTVAQGQCEQASRFLQGNIEAAHAGYNGTVVPLVSSLEVETDEI